MNFYTVLELTPHASLDDIKKAFRRLAKQYHPDVSQDPEAESRFKLIYMAYEILSDAGKRQLYDELQVLKAEAARRVSEERMRRWEQRAERQAEGYARMEYEEFDNSLLSRIRFHTSQGFAFVFSFGLLCLGFMCIMTGSIFVWKEHFAGAQGIGYLLWAIGAAFAFTGGAAILGVFQTWK